MATGFGVVLVVGLYFSPGLFDRFVLPVALPYLPGSGVPPRGVEASEVPLGSPPDTVESSQYRFQESPDPAQPFTAYDPCRPIHYVVRPDNAPPGSDILIQDAIARVSTATGLHFVNDGATNEAPSEEREKYQPGTYGKRWAPVLIAWATPEESPGLVGIVAGLGGSSYAHTPGHPYVYVAGQVQLDAPALSDVLQYPEGPAQVRAVIMHEVAHVLGLDHVDDPTQLMHVADSNVTDFGDGDRAGLALLGAGACVPQL